MSAPFRKVNDTLYVSPQIAIGHVADAKDLGVGLVMNNRTEGEAPNQVPTEEMQAAVEAAGLKYVSIPIGPRGITTADLEAFNAALEASGGKMLAYCGSGTRSITLRTFARAFAGDDIDLLLKEAADAGYDLSGHRDALVSVAGD